MRTGHTAGALLLLLLVTGCGTLPEVEAIRPDSEHPRYWRYNGQTVLLVGGSKEDNLFQVDSPEIHLELLASAGGNYVRNTMSSRDYGNVWPFERLPDGRYDLNRLSDAYFARFERLLELAAERDVIVQIELWDRFDFAQEPWLDNPYRPANNVNYTPKQSGLENEYARHPGKNDNPFFRSIPVHDETTGILPYQHRQVDRLLEISLQYPNVLYTIDNETSATAEWGAYWAAYIQRRAAERGVTAYVTEMWGARDIEAGAHRHTLDHPELYAFADISQNNHQTSDEHWDNLQWAREYVASRPRPLNNVKIYGADGGRFGTTRDAVERFWRNILGGAASVRFHRPPGGIGLDPTAQSHIRSARVLESLFDIFAAEPDAGHTLLLERELAEAYLAFSPSRQYAVYFPDGGDVKLDLTDEPGRFSVRWLDATNSRVRGAAGVEGGDVVRLVPPEDGHWVAVLTKEA